MVKLIRENNPKAIVIIDAAHAPGLLQDLEIERINPDYLLGNFHKWVYSDKTAAFFWCKNKIKNLKTDHFNRLAETSNLPGILSAHAGMLFYEKVGFERLDLYCNDLLDWAESEFAKIPDFLDENFKLGREQPCCLRTLKLSKKFAERAQNSEDLQGVQEGKIISIVIV